ncbi:MAG: hypothetical protein GKR90_09200 [Pseudomonadales bacterium]|nr:hypothetical protein [Pseudomonadales bacterium]
MREDEIRELVRAETAQILQENSGRRELLDALFRWIKWAVGFGLAALGFFAAIEIANEYFGDEIEERIDSLQEGGIASITARVRSISTAEVKTYSLTVGKQSNVIENATFCALTDTDGACGLSLDQPVPGSWLLESHAQSARCEIVCINRPGGEPLRIK